MPTASTARYSSFVSYTSIQRAASNLSGVAHKTPVLTSGTIDSMLGSSVFLKCENFQRIGAFKFRGAFNAMSLLSPKEREKGVITYSSGNHAQAIALSGKLLDIATTIVMPRDAPEVKLRATGDYGAEIVLYDKHKITREDLAINIASERGLTIIPPYDHPDIIAGQGTTAKEFHEETTSLDVLLIPCGGGGLLSGCAIASKAMNPYCKVIGVEPAGADDATRSFHSGILQKVHNPETIADGARTPSLGKHTFPIIINYVNDMLVVSDHEIIAMMRLVWERMKIVVEPTGVLAAAALLAHAERFRGMRVGVILSGGNVDLKNLALFF